MDNKLLYILFFVLLFLSSCHDDLEINTSIDEELPSPEVIKETSGSIIGYVYDENDNPVANAIVSTYAEETNTDDYGVFRLKDTPLDGNGTFIRIKKDGYIDGSDMIYPKDGLNHSYIQLLQLSQSGTFNSANGGVINVEGGGTIRFTPNSISDANGSTYNGDLIVTAKRISPDQPDFVDKMPGALIAQDNQGYTRVLGTLGMLAVELRSPEGEELNLSVGTTAECTFALSDEVQQYAPNSIATWSFDENKNIWIEEGTAELVGNFYRTEVSHFSFWNCDAPFPLIHVCGNIIFDDGSPAENMQVIVQTAGLGSATGYTDSEGAFCGKMPAGVPLTIMIFNPFCPDEIQSIDIGPFSQNTQLDDIILNTQQFTLYGQVNCLTDPVTDGYLLISANGNNIVYELPETGNYEIDLSSILCNNINAVEVFAVNAATGQASQSINVDLSVGEFELDIEVCADCEFDVGIAEGDITDCNEVRLIAEVSGGSGDYTITWDTEEDGEEILSFGGLVCVTVLDNVTQCDQTVCSNIEERSQFIVSVEVLNASCGLNNGVAERIVENGIEPYSFEWLDESGIIISNEAVVVDLAPGTYTLNATDGNNCLSSTMFDIIDAGDISLEFEIEIICPETWVYPFGIGGTGPYEFFSDDGQTGDVFIFNVPGEYCITAVDANGCEIVECVLVEDYEQPFYSATQECTGFTYDIQFNDFNGFQYQITINNEITDTSFSFMDGDLWTYNILDLGFEFQAFIFGGANACESFAFIQLPNYTGLEVVANEASCDVCEDGWIDASFAVNGDCWTCEEDLIEIYAENDLTNELSNINGAMELPSGDYYVIVKDVEGCVVAFELVTI